MHGHEARAEAVEAGIVLVAGGLVDHALAAPLGLHRLDGDAIGCEPAIAAALADGLVDEDALGGIGIEAPLAPAALLGRAGLIIDQHRDAGLARERCLHPVQLVPVVHADHVGNAGRAAIFPRLVGDDGNPPHALGEHLAGELRHGQATIEGLAAGHGHRIVVEQLEGDVGAGRERCANGQNAGVNIGPVTDVLEHVRALGEGRLADPVGALAPHLGEALGRPVHPLHHVVAADPGIGAGAFRQAGGAVVRAAGAEIGNAGDDLGALDAISGDAPELGQARLQRLVTAARNQPLAEGEGDLHGLQRALGRKERALALVLLADDGGRIGPAIELLLDLGLDEGALLLHHHDEIEPLGEALDAFGLQGPDQADLVESEAKRIGPRLVDAERIQRLAHVEIALARGHDADPRGSPAGEHQPVEAVGAGEGEDGRSLVIVQPRLLGERRVMKPDIEPALGHLEIVRDGDGDAIHAPVHAGGGFDIVLHAFDADPHARIAREGEPLDAEVENLLNARRVEHRHHGIDEGELALVGGGGGLAGVVVPHQRQNAPMARGAGMVGVAEHVARAIDSRPLAVPDGEHAIMLALAPELGLLAAPYGGGGEILVEAGLEDDLLGLEQRPGACEPGLQRGDGRAAIARHIAGRIQPRRPVARPLHEREAHHRLRAGEQHPVLRQIERVLEADFRLLRHEGLASHDHRGARPAGHGPIRSAMLTYFPACGNRARHHKHLSIRGMGPAGGWGASLPPSRPACCPRGSFTAGGRTCAG